jgi:hypothetical protein
MKLMWKLHSPIIVDAWRYGLIVYELAKGTARTWLQKRLMVCLDYKISARKLGVLREATKSIIRRWRLGVIVRLTSTITEYTSKLDKLAKRGLKDWVEELAVLHTLQP